MATCLNPSKGNMYPFVGFTLNFVRGPCKHDCSYCFMKRFNVGELRLEEKCFEGNLGSGKTIFVGSSYDMWEANVPREWILQVLAHCEKFPHNRYLFQSKNPERFLGFRFPSGITTLGTTIESDIDHKFSIAPPPVVRAEVMTRIVNPGIKKMVSAEPLCKFNLDAFASMLIDIKPAFVSIGADSQGHNLPEPPPEKIKPLIETLRGEGIDVRLKDNLRRLYIGEGAKDD